MTRPGALLLILLAGCTTTPPAIVDHWVPPQATTAADPKYDDCVEDPLANTPVAEANQPAAKTADAGVVQRPVPCVAQELVTEVVAAAVPMVRAAARDAKPAVTARTWKQPRSIPRPATRSY